MSGSEEAVANGFCKLEANNQSVRNEVTKGGYGAGEPSVLHKFSERRDESVFDLAMVQRLCVGKYRTSIFGEALLKDATSLHQYTMLMERVRPGTIFDLGTAGGGSALWFAAQIRALKLDGVTRVVTFDIEDMRSARCKEMMDGEGSITFVQGDLYDGANVLRRAGVDMPHPWIIAEDCHVNAGVIFRAFFELGMAKGDYVVFEDTQQFCPEQSGMSALDVDNYRYGKFNSAKRARLVKAVEDAGGDEAFAVDSTVQDLYGYNGALHQNSVLVKL